MTRCLAIIYIAMVELEGERFFFLFIFLNRGSIIFGSR